MQLKEGQKWDCPTSIFLCKTNNALNLNSFYIFHCFLSILFVAIFLKVYKCERKFSKLVGKIKPAFLRKTFDFLSETKDRRDQRLCHMSGQKKSRVNNTFNTLNLILMFFDLTLNCEIQDITHRSYCIFLFWTDFVFRETVR